MEDEVFSPGRPLSTLLDTLRGDTVPLFALCLVVDDWGVFSLSLFLLTAESEDVEAGLGGWYGDWFGGDACVPSIHLRAFRVISLDSPEAFDLAEPSDEKNCGIYLVLWLVIEVTLHRSLELSDERWWTQGSAEGRHNQREDLMQLQ